MSFFSRKGRHQHRQLQTPPLTRPLTPPYRVFPNKMTNLTKWMNDMYEIAAVGFPIEAASNYPDYGCAASDWLCVFWQRGRCPPASPARNNIGLRPLTAPTPPLSSPNAWQLPARRVPVQLPVRVGRVWLRARRDGRPQRRQPRDRRDGVDHASGA